MFVNKGNVPITLAKGYRNEDELADALRDNVITREQYDKAYLTANQIMDELDGKVESLKVICNTYFQTLKIR